MNSKVIRIPTVQEFLDQLDMISDRQRLEFLYTELTGGTPMNNTPIRDLRETIERKINTKVSAQEIELNDPIPDEWREPEMIPQPRISRFSVVTTGDPVAVGVVCLVIGVFLGAIGAVVIMVFNGSIVIAL